MSKMNSNDPKTKPCGTPCYKRWGAESLSSMLVYRFLISKNVFSQLFATFLIP